MLDGSGIVKYILSYEGQRKIRTDRVQSKRRIISPRVIENLCVSRGTTFVFHVCLTVTWMFAVEVAVHTACMPISGLTSLNRT